MCNKGNLDRSGNIPVSGVLINVESVLLAVEAFVKRNLSRRRTTGPVGTEKTFIFKVGVSRIKHPAFIHNSEVFPYSFSHH